MRKCYLKVFFDASFPGRLSVHLFDIRAGKVRGGGLDLRDFPVALRRVLSEGVFEVRSYDRWNELLLSFPVHPTNNRDNNYPAQYGNLHLDMNGKNVYICRPFLLTLIGKDRYKELTEQGESQIAYLNVEKVK